MVYSRGVAEKKSCSGVDLVKLGPPGPNGARAAIRHTKDHQFELGVVAPTALAPEGQAVHLTPRGGDLYEVTEVTHSGPAQVSSDAYRNGWDRIFGSKTVGQA